MTSFSLQLSTAQKDILDDINEELKQLQWEKGEYLFYDFVEYFQLPQIIRISQPWDTTLTKDDTLYLQSVYDRHLIVSKSLTPEPRTFMLPDWFQGQCRIISPNPIYKPRWWEFHNAMDLLRFQMPRPHIRLLRSLTALLLLPTNETRSVLLKENIVVTLKRIEKSSTITKGKEMFVLGDKNDQEFLVDPTDTTNTHHFAVRILDDEFDNSYHKDTTENLFTLPEVLIRYELPIDIEIATSHNTIPIENFPTKLTLQKFSIAKSIIAFSIGDSNQARILEFSSLTQFSLRCVKSITTGLPRDVSVAEEPETFDEAAYRHYENVRERLVQLFEDVSIQYMRTPFIGNEDEIECIEKVYDFGTKLKNEERTETYTLLDEASSTNNPPSAPVASVPKHPSRFTVHLPADFNSPYSNTIEINDDDDDHEIPPSTNP